MVSARAFTLVSLLVVFTLATASPALGSGSTDHARTVSSEPDPVDGEDPDPTTRDLDGDGDPDLVVFEANLDADGSPDEVLAYDRADDMERGVPPEEAIDYRNDLLIYDAGSDGTAELVVSFSRVDGEFPWRAEIYDTTVGDLDYELDGDSVSIPAIEDGDPSVTMASKDPWIHDGAVSYSLRIDCAGGVQCSLDGNSYEGGTAEIRVTDPDGDGTPSYEVRQIDTGFSEFAAVRETEMMVNEGDETTIGPEDGIVWPYVGRENFSYVKGTNSAQPPIHVDWDDGTVEEVGELVASRGDEDNYFVYSFQEIEPNRTNPPSFEFPFAYYDLADDDDGVPELQIRMVSNYRGSPNTGLRIFPSLLPFDLTFSRYSWDQTNDGRWDYKIGVLGTNGYSDVASVGPYDLRMPSYGALPEWVQSRSWRTVTFVASPRGFGGSEGIYEGGFSLESRRQLLGLDRDSSRALSPPEEGYRLEVNERYFREPRLYYSPIDGSLHLHGLEYGYWNRSGEPSVEYHDVDGDPYVDVWRERGESGGRRLVAEDTHLIFANGSEVSLVQASVNHSGFITAPPTTTAEWEALRDRVPDGPNGSLDLGATFRRYEGDTLSVTGATLTDYVPTDRGFRLLATTSPSSRVEGDESVSLPDSDTVALIYDEESGDFRAVAATPPSLSIENATIPRERATPLERSPVTVAVRNNGWQTARNVSVRLVEGDRVVANRTVSVVGKRTRHVRLPWWPRSELDDIRVVVESGTDVHTERVNGDVASRERPSLLDRYRVANRSRPVTLGLGIAILVGTVLIGRRVVS